MEIQIKSARYVIRMNIIVYIILEGHYLLERPETYEGKKEN